MQVRLGSRGTLRPRIAKLRRCGAIAAAFGIACFPAPAVSIPTFAVEPAPKAVEQPAMWVLSDSDTTIYLFGTFHALDERTDWLARPIRAAFDSSEELVLETVVPTDPGELIGILSRHGMVVAPVPGAPVIAADAGSFADTARSTMAASRSAGMTVDRGADAVLRRIADAEGKTVDGLESFDFQVGMVRTLPASAPQAHSPSPASGRPIAIGHLLSDMRSAWKRGDGSGFAAVLGTLEAQSPTTYQRLFVERNKHWAGWIADRMTRPGTVFVAVGTGHLIGRDSVQQKLARHGYRATRVR